MIEQNPDTTQEGSSGEWREIIDELPTNHRTIAEFALDSRFSLSDRKDFLASLAALGDEPTLRLLSIVENGTDRDLAEFSSSLKENFVVAPVEPTPLPLFQVLSGSFPELPGRFSDAGPSQNGDSKEGALGILRRLKKSLPKNSNTEAITFIDNLAEKLERDESTRIHFAPVVDAAKVAYETIRDRNASHQEKAGAADKVISALEAVALSHVPEIVTKIQEQIDSTKNREASGELQPPNELTGALHLFQNPSEDSVRAAIPLLSGLVRELWGLEQEKVFTGLTEGGAPADRFQAGASLLTDLYYLTRQGRAMFRLVGTLQQGFQRFQEHQAVISRDGFAGLARATTQKEILEATLRDIANPLASSLEDLGPFWHKLAQTFGAIAYPLSPEAYGQVEQFQNQVTQRMAPPKVREIVERDLGGRVEDLFEEFAEEPFAVASIAQVHRAKIRMRNGEVQNVVVKVKKETVVEELKWNIRVNKSFGKLLKASSAEDGNNFLIDLVSDQLTSLGETFQGELDFAAEARRQSRFRRLYAFHRNVHVPKVYQKLSGDSVITMDDVGDLEKLNFRFTKSEMASGGDAEPHLEEETPTSSGEESIDTSSLKDKKDQSRIERNQDPFLELREIYSRLAEQCGYRFGSHYLQFFRGIAPAVGLLVALPKPAQELMKDTEKATPGEKEQLELLKARGKNALNLVLGQIFHIKELHTDLQPANVLVGEDNSLYVLDFGQTMKTKGLLLRPMLLGKDIATGNAKGAAKQLAKMGTLPEGKSYEDLVPVVQSAFDELGIEQTSLISLLLDFKREKEARSEEFDIEEEIDHSDLSDSEEEREADDISNENPLSAEENARESLKRPAPDFRKFSLFLARDAIQYPFKRFYFGALSLYDKAANALGW